MTRYGKKGYYTKEYYKPDQIDFSKNLALQNERVSIAGGQTSQGIEQVEAWNQAINSLESLLAGWWDFAYKQEVAALRKNLPDKPTLQQKVEHGHKMIAALMRLQKRAGFQGEKFAEGFTEPQYDKEGDGTTI